LVRERALEAAERDEALVQVLLGKWVSELEPQLFRRAGSGGLIGIGAVGASEPSILIDDLA
jgi:hypothetical protein